MQKLKEMILVLILYQNIAVQNNNRIAALIIKIDNIPKQRIHNFLILNICKYKE